MRETKIHASHTARLHTRRILSRSLFSPPAPEQNVMEREWNNIIILDACRYDQFERADVSFGQLEARVSAGSSTPEFLTKNFEGESFYDTVYVTANPMYRTLDLEGVFHEVVDVWDEAWDDEERTVRPEDVAEAGKNVHEAYPDKRLIVHFMQPHYPFIGEKAEKIGSHSGFEWSYRKVKEGESSRDDPTVWDLLREGVIDEEVARDAYDENLDIVLPYVEELLESFEESTVVTSDHGNLVGEKLYPFGGPRYGHPDYTYAEELRKVPWLIVEGDSQKTTTAEDPADAEHSVSEDVTDRLADLGYA